MSEETRLAALWREAGQKATAFEARALAAEAKLARLEGLERAAREYAREFNKMPPSTIGALTDLCWHLSDAARAYASENGE